ncbi:MAG TPA: hypothetical protein VM123_01620 [archaeon]|nr:hypothetical protein [archaeon]
MSGELQAYGCNLFVGAEIPVGSHRKEINDAISFIAVEMDICGQSVGKSTEALRGS